MRCEECREDVSAQLDGERPEHAAPDVQAHLDSCPDCRQWAEDAALVTRLARTELARPAPDVTDRVLAQAPARRRVHLDLVLRIVLVLIGVSQLGLGLAQILGRDGGHHVIHFGHESAAWNIALGVGFAWIGWRVTRAAGLVPTLTAFILVLSTLSVLDLAAGHVDLGRLSTHALVLLGYVVVLVLALRTRHRGDAFPSAASPYRARKSRRHTDEAQPSTSDSEDGPGGSDGLRPTGRRAA